MLRFAHFVMPEDGDHDDPFTALLVSRAARVRGADDAQLVARWERSESVLNARMKVILAIIGPGLPSSVRDLLVGHAQEISSLRVTAGRNPVGGKRNDGLFGQPDIVLLGDNAAVAIEMKVRGGRARACYDAGQHFKYLCLAEALRQQRGVRSVCHVLLAPLAYGVVVRQSDSWLSGPVEHCRPLDVRRDDFIALLPDRHRRRVAAAGGDRWLDSLLCQTPSRFVDLGQFLESVQKVKMESAVLKGERDRQVSALRAFALQPYRQVAR